MKSHIKLILFAILVFVILQVLNMNIPIKSFITKISPNDFVSQKILYTEYVSVNTPYTLNIYTDVSTEDFPYSEENQLVKNVANYAPSKISVLLKPNTGFEVDKIKQDTKIISQNFAVLMDKKGYILSAYPYPFDRQLILSNLINISNSTIKE